MCGGVIYVLYTLYNNAYRCIERCWLIAKVCLLALLLNCLRNTIWTSSQRRCLSIERAYLRNEIINKDIFNVPSTIIEFIYLFIMYFVCAVRFVISRQLMHYYVCIQNELLFLNCSRTHTHTDTRTQNLYSMNKLVCQTAYGIDINTSLVRVHSEVSYLFDYYYLSFAFSSSHCAEFGL